MKKCLLLAAAVLVCAGCGTKSAPERAMPEISAETSAVSEETALGEEAALAESAAESETGAKPKAGSKAARKGAETSAAASADGIPATENDTEAAVENSAGENSAETSSESAAEAASAEPAPAEATAEAAGDSVKTEEADPLYADLEGLAFSFSSGVGAWQTLLQISPDGSFTGYFCDANMGEDSEIYKNGTIYECDFSGRLDAPARVDAYTYTTRIAELKYSKTTASGEDRYIEDNTQYILTDPYGLQEGDTMEFYLAGKPLEELTDEMKMWGMFAIPEDAESLTDYAIHNATQDLGFYVDSYASVRDAVESSLKETSEETAPAADPYEALKTEIPDQAPASPYESVSFANLQGRWVCRFTEGGRAIEEILTIEGRYGTIEDYADGVPIGAWNGRGEVTIEDRGDRGKCPALRINDEQGNLCTIYIRWVSEDEFYDGGFLRSWIRES